MLFTDDVLFLHVPKTGGMSITTYLLNNLRGPLRLAVPKVSFDDAKSRILFSDVNDRLTLIVGRRHETLRQAADITESVGLRLDDFKVIFAVIRNPFDLELSHFRQMQTEGAAERRGPNSPAIKIARAGDFERFCAEIPYFGGHSIAIEEYFTIAGTTPRSLSSVRFETMTQEIASLVEPYSMNRITMPKPNSAKKTNERELISPVIKQMLLKKYEYLFRFYEQDV